MVDRAKSMVTVDIMNPGERIDPLPEAVAWCLASRWSFTCRVCGSRVAVSSKALPHDWIAKHRECEGGESA